MRTDGRARGIAIEANLDRGRGAVATVLVQSGPLHVGDTIVAVTDTSRLVQVLRNDGGTTFTQVQSGSYDGNGQLGTVAYDGATAALGADQVSTLLMPSPWSSAGSIDDAVALAKRLGLKTTTLPIRPLMDGFNATLNPALGEDPNGVTAENLQSRIRGTLLMAVANQQGQLLLTTGNKSELAVGYCTLYGDMNGGLAVIGDLYKTSVFALCDWLDSPASQPLGLACLASRSRG